MRMRTRHDVNNLQLHLVATMGIVWEKRESQVLSLSLCSLNNLQTKSENGEKKT